MKQIVSTTTTTIIFFQIFQITIFAATIFFNHSNGQSIPIPDTWNETPRTSQSPQQETAGKNSRSKRTATVRGDNHEIYPYGIVPVSYGRDVTRRFVIRQVMEHLENLTCIRFVPRISRDNQWAKDLYILGHDRYIEFVHTNTCASGHYTSHHSNHNHQYDNEDTNNGRAVVNCCLRNLCVQEIGLALGLSYEYQNPNSDGYLRINFNEMSPEDRLRFMPTFLGNDNSTDSPFDISSPMGYRYDERSANAPITLLTRDVSLEKQDFYMYQKISENYRCRQNNCSNFDVECVNDGYVTMIQGICTCRCPEGLNPRTGCATVLTSDRSGLACGGVFDLNATTPAVNFTKFRFQTFGCSWLIKAPLGDNIVLEFGRFNVSMRYRECEDEVEIRHLRIGQVGKRFCGTKAPTLIRSYHNMLMITFHAAKRPRNLSIFDATAKLVSEENLCYNPRDKGFTYGGVVNFTRDYSPCVEWWRAAHCPHNPYNFRDMASQLDRNYCRNPGNGLMPWCYVQASHCRRKYCDVCMMDARADARPDCQSSVTNNSDFCNHSEKNQLRRTCAKTCKTHVFSTQPSAVSVSCTQPLAFTDSVRVDKQNQTIFEVGEFVTYKCQHVNSLFRTELKKYCLSNGEWSTGTTACLPCHRETGYELFGQSCFSLQTQRKTANQHERTCQTHGGHLADVRSLDEQEFITKLAFDLGVKSVYIGANDMYREGSFRYRDYLAVTWSNWGATIRNGRRRDCVWTDSRGQWVVGMCNRRLQAVCKMPMLRHRRLGIADCSDTRDDCRLLLDTDREMCNRRGGDFAVTQCPLTCGRCF